MKGFIVYTDYTLNEEKTHILLYGRLENNQSFCVVKKFDNYFFIKTKETSKISKLFTKFEVEDSNMTDFEGNKMTKIYSDNYIELNKLSSLMHKQEVETFESDIKPDIRFIMDYNILGSIEINGDFSSSEKIDRIYQNPEIKSTQFVPNLKVLSIDIESGIKGELFCIGLYSKNYKRSFAITKEKIENTISCKDEESCLEEFKKELIKFDPDIITGWNFIDFDLVYLKNLFEKTISK
jgi:DNA polymerase-2